MVGRAKNIMRFLKPYLFVLMILGLTLSFSPKSFAQTSVAVVDVRYVLSEADAAKALRKQHNDLRTEFLSSISEMEQDLRQQEQELSEEKGSLSSEIYLKKKKEYEQKLLETGRMARDKKQELNIMFKQGMDHLREELTLVVQSIANDEGYNLIISNQNVIAGSDSLDITQEALKRLNKRVPQSKPQDK